MADPEKTTPAIKCPADALESLSNYILGGLINEGGFDSVSEAYEPCIGDLYAVRSFKSLLRGPKRRGRAQADVIQRDTNTSCHESGMHTYLRLSCQALRKHRRAYPQSARCGIASTRRWSSYSNNAEFEVCHSQSLLVFRFCDLLERA